MIPLPKDSGTALAVASPQVAAPRYQTLRTLHLRALTTRLLRTRPLPVAAMASLIVGILVLADFPPARLYAVGGLYGALLVYHVTVAFRARKQLLDENTLFVTHVVILTVQAGIFALTGGLASPLVPVILGPSIGVFLAFGRSRQSVFTACYLSGLVIALALLPEAWVQVVPRYPHGIMLSVTSVVFSVYMLYGGVIGLTDVYFRAGETLERMRAEVVADVSTRTKSLEAIGAKVAHELKNPLAAIKGLVQLLARSDVDARSRERLEVIEEEVTRMEGILRDYLSFSRPLEDLRPERVELGALVDDVLAVLEARAEQASVDIARDGDGPVLFADPRRLKEALMNLVTNAIEATPPRGRVRVSLRGGPASAAVEIRNTGPGIPDDVLSRVGTPFFTTKEGGTGLGVVLARAVVQHHGGELQFSSAPNKGTTVTVTLPYEADRRSCGKAAVCR